MGISYSLEMDRVCVQLKAMTSLASHSLSLHVRVRLAGLGYGIYSCEKMPPQRCFVSHTIEYYRVARVSGPSERRTPLYKGHLFLPHTNAIATCWCLAHSHTMKV